MSNTIEIDQFSKEFQMNTMIAYNRMNLNNDIKKGYIDFNIKKNKKKMESVLKVIRKRGARECLGCGKETNELNRANIKFPVYTNLCEICYPLVILASEKNPGYCTAGICKLVSNKSGNLYCGKHEYLFSRDKIFTEVSFGMQHCYGTIGLNNERYVCGYGRVSQTSIDKPVCNDCHKTCTQFTRRRPIGTKWCTCGEKYYTPSQHVTSCSECYKTKLYSSNTKTTYYKCQEKGCTNQTNGHIRCQVCFTHWKRANHYY